MRGWKKMDEKMDDFRKKVLKTIVILKKRSFALHRLFFVTSLDPTRDAQRSWEAHCMAVFLGKTPSKSKMVNGLVFFSSQAQPLLFSHHFQYRIAFHTVWHSICFYNPRETQRKPKLQTSTVAYRTWYRYLCAGRLEMQTDKVQWTKKNNSMPPEISLLGPHTLSDLSCFSVSLVHARVASSALAAFRGNM